MNMDMSFVHLPLYDMCLYYLWSYFVFKTKNKLIKPQIIGQILDFKT